jgi:hypothetical protein
VNQPDGKPICFLIGIVSVMTRPFPVRCDKSPPGATNVGWGRSVRQLLDSRQGTHIYGLKHGRRAGEGRKSFNINL